MILSYTTLIKFGVFAVVHVLTDNLTKKQDVETNAQQAGTTAAIDTRI